MSRIIESLLDTDQYKFTMGNVAYCQFPDMHVKYRFKWRGPFGVEWTLREKMEILEELEKWCSLKLTNDELDYLAGLNLFDKSYLEFLSTYQPNMLHLDFETGDDLGLSVEGPWCQTIFWELAVLAIVSEVYSRKFDTEKCMEDGEKKLHANIELANDARLIFADFGTRRRFLRIWQEYCVKYASENCPTFVGTSNVLLAKKYNIKPIGTMAHEYLSIGQAIAHPLDAQREMLQRWCDQYRGNLGIALTDIVGLEPFLKDFDYYFAKLYEGVRHDSGCPMRWGFKMIDHYEKLGIDPKTKTLVFSDGLNFPNAIDIQKQFRNTVNVSAGIGTKFTNDVGIKAPQIVMKIVEVNGRPVAKLPDSAGKCMCEDQDYINYLKKVHNRGEF